MAAAKGPSAANGAAATSSCSSWLSEALASGFLTCPICLERLSRPKILPCLHTYCHDCLEKLVAGQGEGAARAEPQELQCPECRARVPLPADGVGGLKSNFFINGLLDLVCPAERASPTCALCPLIGQEAARAATSRCLDCADDMCQVCARGHRCSRLTHTHQVVDVEGYLSGRYDQEVRERQATRCREHPGEELRFFCTPCAIPLCRECRLGPHLQHPCQTLDEAAKERCRVVEGLLREVEKAAQRLAQGRASLEEAAVGLEARRARILDQVEQACSRAVERLLAHQEEVLARLSDYVEGQKKAWGALRSELEFREQVASSTAAFARRVLALGRGAEVLSLEQMILERLGELEQGGPWEPPGVRLPQLEIHPDLEGSRSPFRLEFTEEEKEGRREGQRAEEEEEEVSRAAKKRRRKKQQQQQQQVLCMEGEAPRTHSQEKPASEQAAGKHTEAPGPPLLSPANPTTPQHPQQKIHPDVEDSHSPFPPEFTEEKAAVAEEEEGRKEGQPAEEEEEEEVVSRAEKKKRDRKQQQPMLWALCQLRTGPEVLQTRRQAASHAAAPRPLFSCSFWVKIPTDKQQPQVTGLCPFGSRELLVADKQNRKLKRFSLQGEFKGTVPVPRDVAPFSVAALGSKVAFSAGSQLYLLDGEGGLAWQKVLQMGQASYAVTAVGSDRVAVSVARHLEVYDLEGRLVEKVQLKGTVRHCLVFLARWKGGFVGSDWYRKSVLLVTENGELVAECREEQLDGCQPGSVCADSTGTIYVVLRELNRVVALSPTGKNLGTFLTAEDGINCPRVATVARDGSFAVALSNGTIHIFKIRYQEGK